MSTGYTMTVKDSQWNFIINFIVLQSSKRGDQYA